MVYNAEWNPWIYMGKGSILFFSLHSLLTCMKILYNKTNCTWWSVFQVNWYSVCDDQCFKSTGIDTNWDFFLGYYDCLLLFDRMQHKLTVTHPCHFGDHDLLVLPWFNCNGWLGIKHRISYLPDLFVLGHQKLMFILFSTNYVFKKKVKQFICVDMTRQSKNVCQTLHPWLTLV